MAISTLQNFYKETIAVACTTGATNIYVTTKPTPTNGYLVISSGTESLREIIKYTGTGTDGTGDYVTVASAGDRGLGGTTDQAHEVGETVRMNYTAEHQTEIDDAINAIVAGGAVDASTTNKGISKLSVAPASATEPIAVGDNDPRLSVVEITSGFINLWATGVAPTGWLLCQGQAVSRTTYDDLFTVIGTTYGVGDGTTTFNLPNLQGRVPVGLDSSQTEFDTLGETGGAKTHTLTVDEMPSHSHAERYPTGAGSIDASQPDTGSSLSDYTTPSGSTGGGNAHNNLQPYIVLNYIIKT